MVSPIDQGAILRSGAALIPNLAEQYLQQQQIDLQRQDVGLRQQAFQAKQQDDQREQAEQMAYQRDMETIGTLPPDQQPMALAALSRRYPKQSEALKRSWDMQDAAVKDANFRETADTYFLIKNGGADKAAAKIRKRIEADKAAGQDTEDDEAIATALESGDEAEVGRAMAAVTAQLQVAAGPERFASIAGVVNPGGTEFEKQYEYIKANFGQEAADNFARNKYDPFVESNNKYGTTFYRSSDLAGGGPAPSQGVTGGGGDTGGPAATEDEAAAILGGAMRSKFITAEDFARIEASLGPNGKERAQAWLRNQKVQIGKVIGGKRYVQRGKDWFEVN